MNLYFFIESSALLNKFIIIKSSVLLRQFIIFYKIICFTKRIYHVLGIIGFTKQIYEDKSLSQNHVFTFSFPDITLF